ncbi:hypothetical protein B7494_g4410 [Chlorociboria aeruginascens]|nr:hypothetical protein B7494_g4410 [Chlorociboria aeruginascens]
MPSPSRPSTPVTRKEGDPQTPETGTWRHPKFDEITRRQNASRFTDRNLNKVMYNIGGWIMLWVVGRYVWQTFPNLMLPGKLLQPYANYIFHILQVSFAFNIISACMPLFRTIDDLSDIPLTPAQRKLLGLPPSSKPPTPGSQYSTPPRYARTPTPLSGSPGSREKDIYSGSPLSGKGSPFSVSSSPFSQGASPLLHKAIGGGLNTSRRHSYGSPSPLGPGAPRFNLPESGTPSTPSPSSAKGASIGLNNRWLYEKGRRNSGSSRLYA